MNPYLLINMESPLFLGVYEYIILKETIKEWSPYIRSDVPLIYTEITEIEIDEDSRPPKASGLTRTFVDSVLVDEYIFFKYLTIRDWEIGWQWPTSIFISHEEAERRRHAESIKREKMTKLFPILSAIRNLIDKSKIDAINNWSPPVKDSTLVDVFITKTRNEEVFKPYEGYGQVVIAYGIYKNKPIFAINGISSKFYEDAEEAAEAARILWEKRNIDQKIGHRVSQESVQIEQNQVATKLSQKAEQLRQLRSELATGIPF